MSLLSQASLVVVPSGYKEDVVYSVKPTDGSGDLTFTRASDGTRVNSQGLVERVPWNLLQQSNTFNTTWTALNGGAVTSGQSGYDGTNNAWSLSKTAANGEIRQTVLLGLRTFSVYAKAGSLNWLYLLKGGNAGQYFNLGTGQVGTGNAQVISANIESVGGGWYLCSMVYNDAYDGSLRIYPADADNDTSGTSGSIYIQNAQLVEGSTAKPYFPTTDRLNVPRLDYSNGCPSLLLEPQRTNLVTYSEQLDGTGWGYQNTNIVSNATTSPDGTTNADAIIEQNTTGEHNRYTYPATTAAVYTASVFLKKYNATWCALYIFNPITGKGIRHWINLDTLTAGTSANIGIGISAPMTLEDYGNGWVRASITFTADVTEWRFYIGNAQSNGGATSYTGDGTSGLYAWGAQLEAGSYPTSYIPTTSASVTRVADVARKTGISSLIGQTEGTLFLDITLGSNPLTLRLFSVSASYWLDHSIRIDWNAIISDSKIVCEGVYSAAQTFILNSINAYTSGTRLKIGIAYKSNDCVMYINGVQQSTDTSTGTIPACSVVALNELYGFGSGSFEKNDFNQAVLFKTRLTNAELAALTTL